MYNMVIGQGCSTRAVVQGCSEPRISYVKRSRPELMNAPIYVCKTERENLAVIQAASRVCTVPAIIRHAYSLECFDTTTWSRLA
jgi:hypothetical protein